jgi:hypothetical protein
MRPQPKFRLSKTPQTSLLLLSVVDRQYILPRAMLCGSMHLRFVMLGLLPLFRSISGCTIDNGEPSPLQSTVIRSTSAACGPLANNASCAASLCCGPNVSPVYSIAIFIGIHLLVLSLISRESAGWVVTTAMHPPVYSNGARTAMPTKHQAAQIRHLSPDQVLARSPTA